MAERSSSNTLLVPLVAGLAGAVAGLLLAPRSGRETREQLRVNANKAKQQATEGLDTARTSLEEGLEKAKDAKSRLAETIKTRKPKATEVTMRDTYEDNAQRNLAPRAGTAWEEEV